MGNSFRYVWNYLPVAWLVGKLEKVVLCWRSDQNVNGLRGREAILCKENYAFQWHANRICVNRSTDYLYKKYHRKPYYPYEPLETKEWQRFSNCLQRAAAQTQLELKQTDGRPGVYTFFSTTERVKDAEEDVLKDAEEDVETTRERMMWHYYTLVDNIHFHNKDPIPIDRESPDILDLLKKHQNSRVDALRVMMKSTTKDDLMKFLVKNDEYRAEWESLLERIPNPYKLYEFRTKKFRPGRAVDTKSNLYKTQQLAYMAYDENFYNMEVLIETHNSIRTKKKLANRQKDSKEKKGKQNVNRQLVYSSNED
jgi:hypothetical protein